MQAVDFDLTQRDKKYLQRLIAVLLKEGKEKWHLLIKDDDRQRSWTTFAIVRRKEKIKLFLNSTTTTDENGKV